MVLLSLSLFLSLASACVCVIIVARKFPQCFLTFQFFTHVMVYLVAASPFSCLPCYISVRVMQQRS